MFMTATKRFHFCYAHYLQGHPKCGKMHGHNGILDITVEGIPHELTGMIMDFGELSKRINAEIMPLIDHNLLNNEITGPPTAENIVISIREWILAKKLIPKEVKLARIRLYETPDSWVDWRIP